MPGTGQTFYIAGAGITGLTLALALAKFGATVIVLERGPVVSEFGAGLQISPNARRVLDSLGLAQSIAQRSFEPVGIDVYPHRAKTPVVTLELGDIMRQRFGAPYAVMHRADLADALHRATRPFANIDILFGVRGWDAVSHARGITVSIDEGNGQSRTGRGKALIGADGVHSATRRNLLAGPDADFAGCLAWRTLLPAAEVADLLPLDRVSVFLGPGMHVVTYPLPHRGQVNLVLFAPTRDAAPPDGQPELPASIRQWPELAAVIGAATDWTPWPVYSVEAPHWHDGNIGLAGDAAHAMLPFQAQGAAMGIEDAAVLAPLLVRSADPAEAFARYAALRRQRVARVARQSRANGRIFHMPWPLSLARDTVMRLQGAHGHLGRLAWLYDYDATTPG